MSNEDHYKKSMVSLFLPFFFLSFFEIMSNIIHKIIDRATRHTTEKEPQRRSFFGFSNTNGSSITITTTIDEDTSLGNHTLL